MQAAGAACFVPWFLILYCLLSCAWSCFGSVASVPLDKNDPKKGGTLFGVSEEANVVLTTISCSLVCAAALSATYFTCRRPS